jgi:PGF-pre-PGF domain-containing protein
LVLALLSNLVVHVAMGNDSSGEVGGATDSPGLAHLRAQSGLTAVLPTVAAQVASTTEEMVRHIGGLTLDDAAATVGTMEEALAAGVMVEMDNEKSADIMGLVDSEKGALIMAEMPAELAVWMMGAMEVEKVSDMWSRVEKVKAGEIMEMVPIEIAVKVVEMISEERLVPRLPEMSPQKLWEFPLELLMEKLPGVPVMHLDSWNRPPVPADLVPAETTRSDEDVTEYALAEARESQWAVIVGSPAPIERVWARFSRPLFNVRIKVESFDERPVDTPDFPQDQIANSFFAISLEGAQPQDLMVAAAIVSVDKSWLQANQVHKWSVRFNQFDRGLGAWVPSPSKRIREDQERISFAVVVPGFSPLAITGSRSIVEPRFRVSDLEVSPESPRAGEEFTVSARVTNLSSQTAVYPAKLWLNRFVQDAENIVVAPGSSIPFSFSARKPEGVYTVRVERLIDEFIVLPSESPGPGLPSVGGVSPRALSLVALMVLAVGLVSSGFALLRRSR